MERNLRATLALLLPLGLACWAGCGKGSPSPDGELALAEMDSVETPSEPQLLAAPDLPDSPWPQARLGALVPETLESGEIASAPAGAIPGVLAHEFAGEGAGGTVPPALKKTPTPVPALRPLVRSAEMNAVAAKADEAIRRGLNLADRGAVYSARTEFLAALRLIAQAYDVQTTGRTYSQALSAGMRALDEADDFVPRGSRLESGINVPLVVSAHATPVLKEERLENMASLVALQRYYTYAYQQFTIAAADEPVCSRALHGLGRLQAAGNQQSAAAGKSTVYYQAAVTADKFNALAANDLGVQMARFGRLADAKRLLVQSVMAKSDAATWHNLAVVHHRLGEYELSQQAQNEEQTVIARGGAAPSPVAVQWVQPEVFAASGQQPMQAGAPTQVASQPRQPAAGAKSSKKTAWQPWSNSSRR